MEHIKFVLLEFLKAMLRDLKRRASEESGSYKTDTEGRIETLEFLIKELES